MMFDSTKFTDNLREGGFLIACLMLVYLLAVLFTYTEGDPSFSNAADSEVVGNAGGVFGAYVSALMFELFGRGLLSALRDYVHLLLGAAAPPRRR